MVNFAPLLPLIRDEFGLTNAWAGILGSATIVVHGLLQLPGAQVPEKFGIKRSLEAGMVLMAFGIAASAASPNIEFLFACRALMGIGTAISFISALTFVNEIAPANRRQVIQGLFGAAANVGVLLVMLASGLLAHLAGWRGAFLVEGVVLLGVAAILSVSLRSDVRFAHRSAASWGEVLGRGHLYLLGLAHILTYGAFTGISAWAVTFLWEQHAIDLGRAGILAAIMPATSIVARVVGGRLAVGRERLVILSSCVVSTLGIALLAPMPSAVLALLALGVVGWFAAMPFGAVFSYPALLTGTRTSGRDLTLLNFVGNIGALAFPPAIGWALDISGSYVAGFGVVALVGLAGSITIALFLPGPKVSRE